ncbi:N-(5'-phosphoribosyl)anthranilate isomerase [Fibrivirga algicola]|uniref:N-(5'-phosphoribosyl)anthranilate isomerase n=1 Tax=Fibrivirga algicola TaxID=2950420 RepID=A0ABX0QBA4_9BACT|nr:N-(5'-phosphoribosyl)anthranilate isomerase [Fibrivirga algicola]NID09158.1 N-(5'-phosphoribosyl)anthranilate isomerase [Fibrivirga algicola]
MALQTTVKISNVTNLSDARYCAGMGVDLLGFSMDTTSPDYIEPARFSEIRGWVAGVHIVGETNSVDPEQIEQLLADYQPDVLQVDEVALLPYLSTLGKPLMLRVDLTKTSLEQLDAVANTSLPGIDYLLLESQSIIHLDEALKTALLQVASRHSVLLGIGFEASTIQALLAELPVAGIALTGGNEERPGSRDFGALMDILEVIEVE